MYLSILQDAAAVLGTYSAEISCNPLETYAWQVGASNQVYVLMLVILGEKCRFPEIWEVWAKKLLVYQWYSNNGNTYNNQRMCCMLICKCSIMQSVAMPLTSWAWTALVRSSGMSWSTSAGCLLISWLGGKQLRCQTTVWTVWSINAYK